MTAIDLAEKLGITRQHTYNLLTGESMPSLELAFRVSEVLGAGIQTLWQLTEVGIRARDDHNRRR